MKGYKHLSDEQVLDIQKRYRKAGGKYGIISSLAREFGVTKKTIHNALEKTVEVPEANRETSAAKPQVKWGGKYGPCTGHLNPLNGVTSWHVWDGVIVVPTATSCPDEVEYSRALILANFEGGE